MATSLSSADRLAAATPEGRDRYVDFLRLFSITVVVLGHWTLTLLVLWGDGGLSNMMAARIATWGLMVMGLFFAVGGFSHAKALTSLQRRGGSYGDFLRSRSTRLLQPVVVLLAVWVVAAAGLELSGAEAWATSSGSHPIALATDRITTPLWFIGVYLAVVLLAPPLFALHQRFGLGALVVLVVLVVLLDVVRTQFDQGWAGGVNLLLVWLAVHQLGFLWNDGLLTRRRAPLILFVLGWGTAIALTVPPDGYTIDMVGLPTTPGGNFAPPNVPLLAHAFGLLGLALLFRAPMNRWLERPKAWLVVALGNTMVMTIFCWHLTAIFLVQGSLLLVGFEPPAAPSAAFWWFLPLWFVLGAIPLAGLVFAARKAEAPPKHTTSGPGRMLGTVVSVVAVILAAAGIFLVSQVGLDWFLHGRPERLIGVGRAPAWPGLLALVVALVALRWHGRTRAGDAAPVPARRSSA
jgi:hypothetical protein